MWQNDRNTRTFWYVKLLGQPATPKKRQGSQRRQRNTNGKWRKTRPDSTWYPLASSDNPLACLEHCATTAWCSPDITTNLRETSDNLHTVLTWPDNPWQFTDNPLTFPNAPNPPLMSPDITWHFKKALKVGWGSQGCVGRKSERCLQSFRWVKQRVVILSGIVECFSPIPISICLPMMRSLTFFGVAECSKSFTNQNVRVLRSFCHILKPRTTFWSWDIGFWKMAVAIEHPVPRFSCLVSGNPFCQQSKVMSSTIIHPEVLRFSSQ